MWTHTSKETCEPPFHLAFQYSGFVHLSSEVLTISLNISYIKINTQQVTHLQDYPFRLHPSAQYYSALHFKTCPTFLHGIKRIKLKKNTVFRFQAELHKNHWHTPSKTNINKAQKLLIPHCYTVPHSKLLPKWLHFKQKQYMLVTILV